MRKTVCVYNSTRRVPADRRVVEINAGNRRRHTGAVCVAPSVKRRFDGANKKKNKKPVNRDEFSFVPAGAGEGWRARVTNVFGRGLVATAQSLRIYKLRRNFNDKLP